jgi:hypothetical protein
MLEHRRPDAGQAAATWREMLKRRMVSHATARVVGAEADDAMKPGIQGVQTP